ncbi:MAG: FecR family protein [Candidatus Marinimicrobia bacterium]|nr:FecR family protein [Candidatus Neomarinimicrobiota bacterium]
MIRFYKIFLLGVFLCCTAIAFGAGGKVVAAISTMKGAVLVKPFGSRKYVPAYKGQMLKSGEWMKTADGVFVAIVFLDGSNIKIQQKTEVKISSYRMTAKELKTNLEMSKGQAWSNVANQGAAGEFTITTPTAVASVKGTEFDLQFDEDSGESVLTVMSGEVSFSNELGELLAGAMESATASEDSGPSKVRINNEDLPSWQKNTDPQYAFKLKTDRMGKTQVGREVKVNIQMINAKNKRFDDGFSGSATVESQSSELLISTDGTSWASSVDVPISNGRGVVQVKSSRQGIPEIIVNGEDAESQSLGFEYYQSKTQKQASSNKLNTFARSKGQSRLADLIKDKALMKSQVTMGAGSVDGVLQKLETGELELDGDPEIIDNGDGTVTIKLKAKPR